MDSTANETTTLCRRELEESECSMLSLRVMVLLVVTPVTSCIHCFSLSTAHSKVQVWYRDFSSHVCCNKFSLMSPIRNIKTKLLQLEFHTKTSNINLGGQVVSVGRSIEGTKVLILVPNDISKLRQFQSHVLCFWMSCHKTPVHLGSSHRHMQGVTCRVSLHPQKVVPS